MKHTVLKHAAPTQTTQWTHHILRITAIALGNLLYAMAVILFILPNGLITGGTTGLALFFHQTAGVPISLFVSVFNVTMFLVGAWLLGKQFAASTLLSTLMYPVLLGFFEGLGFSGFVMEEKLTAVIYAGMLIGAGIGIVMRAGASTGGMDIPALILKKRRNVNVSATIYLCDCVILGLQTIMSDIYAVLYGILLIFVYTIVLNKVLLLGSAKIQVKIVSRKHKAINQMLGERIDCGTSLLHMETGFMHEEQDMVMAVISNRDLPRVNQLIMEIDPEAFIIINQINEVRGRGFTMNKVYRQTS